MTRNQSSLKRSRIMFDIEQPHKEEIELRISQIRNLDLSTVTIEEITELLVSMMKGYKLSTLIYKPGRRDIFRAIRYSEPPNKISDLWYPPLEYAEINRANRRGEQVFYGSSMREIPLFELNARVGNKFVISRWKTTKDLALNNVGYNETIFQKFNSSRQNQKWISEFGVEAKRTENTLIRNFLAECFSQKLTASNPNIYKLTVAIAEKLFNNGIAMIGNNLVTINFEGLIYPTLQMNANGDNIALKRSFIDKGGLELQSVEFVEIKGIMDFKYDLNVIAKSNTIRNGGEIDWEGQTSHWSKKMKFEDLTYNFEDGKWVARNDAGEV
ncbi:MAG: hypothetical protein ACSLE0_21445, partial [Chitinophagaceae bacterium]